MENTKFLIRIIKWKFCDQIVKLHFPQIRQIVKLQFQQIRQIVILHFRKFVKIAIYIFREFNFLPRTQRAGQEISQKCQSQGKDPLASKNSPPFATQNWQAR